LKGTEENRIEQNEEGNGIKACKMTLKNISVTEVWQIYVMCSLVCMGVKLGYNCEK
jgi:hypothetical protein